MLAKSAELVLNRMAPRDAVLKLWDYVHAVTERPLVRVAVRRWRLWWRFQVRAAAWRIRRLFPRGAAGDFGGVPQSGLGLRVGRVAGRVYLFVMKIRERGRISRARLPDRVEPVRTTAALVGMQRTLFLGLAVLIAAGLLLDEALRHAWGPVAGHLGFDPWVRSHFSKPSTETLRNLLGAAAAGTATILGLVLSISLIVWQATADRYRSSTIVAFLLRERLGAAVVRLLALGFAYSLWVLALLEVFNFRPYASAVLALVLSTAAVLSLISYRRLALLGYLPGNIARSLRREIAQEMRRAQRRGAGRSVENYSRQVVEADLQIFRDLLVRLRDDDEILDLVACLDELGKILARYTYVKHRFPPDSLFFAHEKARLGPSAYAIEEAVGSQGLMTPTSDVPDYLWFEKRLLDVAELLAVSKFLREPEIASALIRLWGEAFQRAWYGEDSNAVDLILARVDAVALLPELRANPVTAETLLNIPWAIVEMAGRGFTVTPEKIVATHPWQNERDLSDLPWQAQQDARRLAQQIRTELAVADVVVTPEREMIRELSQVRRPRLVELQARLVERAVEFARAQLKLAAGEKASSAPIVALMTIRTLLRVVHNELELPDLGGLARELVTALDGATKEEADDLRTETGRAARRLAQDQRWSAAYELLAAYEAITLVLRTRTNDPATQVGLFYDGLFTAAIVYGWAEFYGRGEHVREVGKYVQHTYGDLDALSEAAKNHQLTMLGIPSVLHFQWAQPLTIAAGELEDRPVFDGGIGYSLEKNHPSSLFSRYDLLGAGPQDCLEHLLESVVDDRSVARAELFNSLIALTEKRSQA